MAILSRNIFTHTPEGITLIIKGAEKKNKRTDYVRENIC